MSGNKFYSTNFQFFFILKYKLRNRADKWPVLLQGHTEKQPTMHARTGGQFRLPISPHVRVFGLWEEARVAGEKPLRQRENMQTPHVKATGLRMEPVTFLLWGQYEDYIILYI